MKTISKLILSLAAAALCSPLAQATEYNTRAEKSDSTQILYVGNSYTFFNNLPNMVTKLGAKIGKKYAASRVLKGGETLRTHSQKEFLKKILADGGFDYVVIQDASYMPSYSTREVLENVYPYAQRIDSMAKAGSPNVKTIYFMTWGHQDGIIHHQTDYPLDDTYQLMQDRLKTSYLEMAYENGGICAPVGMAWQRVIAERPDIVLYRAKDRYHPAKAGSYLAACTILSTILGDSFTSSYYAGLPKEIGEYLQKVACETVVNNKALIGIK